MLRVNINTKNLTAIFKKKEKASSATCPVQAPSDENQDVNSGKTGKIEENTKKSAACPNLIVYPTTFSFFYIFISFLIYFN